MRRARASKVSSIIDKIGALDPDRDPRVDPRPGDVVQSVQERGESIHVLEAPVRHDDPDLGPEPGVHGRKYTRYGSVARVTMSFETWRAWAKDGTVLPPGSEPW